VAAMEAVNDPTQFNLSHRRIRHLHAYLAQGPGNAVTGKMDFTWIILFG
jgi:hypothetical protein